MSAREEILAGVRAAREQGRVVEPSRTYRHTGREAPGSPEVLALLRERLTEYRATVLLTEQRQLRSAVALADAGGGAVLLPHGLPAAWAPNGTVDDGTLAPGRLDEFTAVVTGCRAETGNMLDGGPDQGRRALSPIPDAHVCVVRADQVVQTVPELLRLVDPARPLTFISGPSASSDIELVRVEGVHGPRTLIVVLVAETDQVQPAADPSSS